LLDEILSFWGDVGRKLNRVLKYLINEIWDGIGHPGCSSENALIENAAYRPYITFACVRLLH